MEDVQNATRRSKVIGSDKLIRYAVDYTRTAKQVADSLCSKYSLKPEEKRHYLKQIRLIRRSQQQFCSEIKSKSTIGHRDADRSALLNWLDDKIESVEAHQFESDDDD